MDFQTLKYRPGVLTILDQTKLPGKEIYRELKTLNEVWDAIYTLALRGAPAIGVGAAYGIAMAAYQLRGKQEEEFFLELEFAAKYLASSRPTAVNLFWAIERMMQTARQNIGQGAEKIAEELEREARQIEQEDKENNRAIGENLLSLLKDGDGVLTHCNAGALCAAHYGTALSPFYLAKERGMHIHVYADETRPLLQGARLTAWELQKNGIEVTLLCDNMAASIMSQGKIDAVIVGCDRVAANGDTANKIGTMGVSILAKYFGIPMYIATPTPTIDWNCKTGGDIPIEQRAVDEVTNWGGVVTAPEGIDVYNPAFDVTPAENISAIVTEKGIIRPPFEQNMKKILCR